MRVLHISNDFSFTKVHSNLYSALDKKNIDQIVFNPVRKFTPIGNNNIEFISNVSEIIYSRQLKGYHRYLFKNKMTYLYRDIKSKTDLKKLDLCHATTLFSDGAIALKIKKTYGTPYLVAIRATDINVFLKYRPDLRNTALRILREAEKIIFIGDSLKKRFLTHPSIIDYRAEIENKCQVIYNGIDDFWLNNIHKNELIEPTKILYVGRLVSRKNIPSLIQSVIAINKNGPQCELNIVGSGGADEKIISDLSRKNKGVINYLGEVKEKKVLKEIYRQNQIFAMPSKGETFGLVYVEALSQGLPILGSKEEGIDNSFDIKIGEFIDPESTESIENGLRKIIRCYNEYELESIDFNIFRWKNIAETYIDLYKKVCES